MEFDKLISERYSVRKYMPGHLSQKIIDKLLDAANKAPTGCNYQPQRILVINSDESIEKLRGCTRCHFGAPTAMLICHNPDESWKRPYDGALSSPSDAIIVATHIMLAAHNEGIGCCFVMHFDPEKMRKAFNIPENIIPAVLLVMGHPSDDSEPLDLHYKKRPLEETVIYDSF